MTEELTVEDLIYFHEQHAAHYKARAIAAEAKLRELKGRRDG
jgi:hypothetical protein